MKTPDRFTTFPAYSAIEPYEVLSKRLGLPIDQIVKLDANENLYGPSAHVRDALANLDIANIYPDPESRNLRDALSVFTGAPFDNLIAGSGADELIDLVLRVILEAEDCVLNFPPTFGMYSFDTLLNNGRVIEIPRLDDFHLDLKAIRASVQKYSPKAIFITTPNNPDGLFPASSEIDELLDLPTLIIIDEAYIEFNSQGGLLGHDLSRIKDVQGRENLVVLRTFSKWAGLAGLRVGYGAFPQWLLPVLWKAKQPYNVNVAASTAAIASLHDMDTLAVNVRKIVTERNRLAELLTGISFLKPYPSEANFILCKVEDMSASWLKQNLESQGILVRYYAAPYLKNYIRISIGKPEHSDILMEALQKIHPGDDTKQIVIPTNKIARTSNDKPGTRSSKGFRKTRETDITWQLNLDGTGKYDIQTGIGFLDHMLAQIAVHGLFDLILKTHGDLHIDPHHTIEDTALALGLAVNEALGDRKGITRMATASCPMDDSLAEVTIDCSGRPYTVFQAAWHNPVVGELPTSLIGHFFESFAVQARCNLHIHVKYGNDDHHKAEAIFKAFARALKAAAQIEPRRLSTIPSTKGVL